MKDLLIPEFEKTHGVKVAFVPATRPRTWPACRRRRARRNWTWCCWTTGRCIRPTRWGSARPWPTRRVKKDVYELAQMGKNAIGLGFVATGFAYNKDWFEREGWEPPKSWKDLKDKKYDQILSIPAISNTYGLHALVMLARNDGGGEKNIDPGFEAMANEVAPNVLVFESSSGKMSELFQSEEIALSVWGSGRAKSLADTGFPATFAYPEGRRRGAFAGGMPGGGQRRPRTGAGIHRLSSGSRNSGQVRRRDGRRPVQHQGRIAAGTGRKPALWRQDQVSW